MHAQELSQIFHPLCGKEMHYGAKESNSYLLQVHIQNLPTVAVGHLLVMPHHPARQALAREGVLEGYNELITLI